VEGYVLEGEDSVVSRLEASLRRGVSPFRGRQAELLGLGECWEQALRKQGQAVCLVGEPGIGKSRLAYEFRKSLGIADRIEGVALSHTRTAAYSVFRQMLRQLAGIDPDADLSTARDRLHRRLWDLEHGAYDLREETEPLVPATISALIASRVGRLPASARELLADAAALGKEFPLTHLRALVPPERVEDDLALAERRGFLDRKSDGPVSTLAFRHVLTQEVTYGTLLQPDRQTRHRRAAEMLEQLYRGRTEEVCDQLAHHWSQSDRRPQALPYLMTAADGAVAVGANQEAIGHLQSALALIGEHPDLAPKAQQDAIRLKLAGLHFITGER
jgi:predicted ATPase